MKSGRNYPLLLISQFLGAFGDNAILAVIVGQLTVFKRQGVITDEILRSRSALYTSLLFIPFILLSPVAGFLNDRYAKTTWLAGGNAVKLLGTLVCAVSIWHGYVWQMPGYLIVGVGSCFYGPAKYGILPEILPAQKLVKANGMVELLTLVAILTGAVGGSFMVDRFSLVICFSVVAGVFAASMFLNLCMNRTPAGAEVRFADSFGGFFKHVRDLILAPRLGKVLIGTALFWVAGAAMKINFQPWGLGVLQLPNNLQVSMLSLWLIVGIMTGSILAGVRHPVGDLTWTRRYGFALVAMLLVVWSVEPLDFWRSWRIEAGQLVLLPWIMMLLAATGLAGGLFLIPLNAALQAESDPAKLGKTIAVQNLFDNIGMLTAGALVTVCVKSESWIGVPISAGRVFLVLAALVGLVVLWLRFPARPAPATS